MDGKRNMLKKRIIAVSSLILIIALLLLLLYGWTTYAVGEFSLQKYHWAIEQFPSTQNVGRIDNAKDAKEKAVSLWQETFDTAPDGSKKDPTENIIQILAYFDKENDCWYLRGRLPDNMVGWVPALLVKSNGEVLAVFYY